MPTRVHVRAVPRTPMTVAFEKEAGVPLAYGAVANYSEGGACVWTAAHFEIGDRLNLRLSAVERTQPLECPAVILWELEETERAEGTHRYGVRWVAPSPRYRSELRALMEA